MVIIEKIIDIAAEASLILTDNKLDFNDHNIEVKTSKRDLATAYDMKVQEKIIASLNDAYPQIAIIGEEEMESSHSLLEGDKLKEFFLIDPVDGTTNLVHDFRHSSISIAYIKEGRLKQGLVMNPYSKEIFTAVEGAGAFLNGKKIHVSDNTFSNALILFGTSPSTGGTSKDTFKILEKVYDNGLDIRRTGSAALDLAYIAAGRADFFFELSLSPWDYGAGVLLVKEAGGIITDFSGKELPFNKKSSVVAGNPTAYLEGIRIIG